jgi:hypothetical protein
MRRYPLILVLAVLSLLAAACAGGDDADPTAEVGTGTEAPADGDDGTAADVTGPDGADDAAAGADTPAGADGPFCDAARGFADAIANTPTNDVEGQAYITDAVTQLEGMSDEAPDPEFGQVIDEVTAYFTGFDALLEDAGYDSTQVDEQAVAQLTEDAAPSFDAFEVLVVDECGVTL